jgi:hypothetical protein
MAHRWEPSEIGGVVEILRSENVRDDEVVGEVGDGLARVSRVSIAALALPLSRAGFHTERRVGRHRGGCRVRVVVSRGFPEKQQQYPSYGPTFCLAVSRSEARSEGRKNIGTSKVVALQTTRGAARRDTRAHANHGNEAVLAREGETPVCGVQPMPAREG